METIRKDREHSSGISLVDLKQTRPSSSDRPTDQTSNQTARLVGHWTRPSDPNPDQTTTIRMPCQTGRLHHLISPSEQTATFQTRPQSS
ncbi:unnamed protein product, partial [Porites evermanni]